MQGIFGDPTLWKGAHNFKFDLNVMRKHFGIRIRGFMFDSMIMHHLLWEYPPHDLETLADQEFGSGDYSIKIRDIVGHGKVRKPYDIIPDDILWPYGANDAELTFLLVSAYYARLIKKPHLWELYLKESEPGVRSLAEAEYWGCPVNAECAVTPVDCLADCQIPAEGEF